MIEVLDLIQTERTRQNLKWGVQNHNVLTWVLILAEEFGEVAKEANEIHFRNKTTEEYKAEMVQVAAVCVAAIESLDRGYK